MSGDHNQNQTTSGWRKRQIALDKKAKNARELGLDYEPSIIEMAREAGAIEMRDNDSMGWGCEFELNQLEAFALLVREDERKESIKALEDQDSWSMDDPASTAIKVIRARGTT